MAGHPVPRGITSKSVHETICNPIASVLQTYWFWINEPEGAFDKYRLLEGCKRHGNDCSFFAEGAWLMKLEQFIKGFNVAVTHCRGINHWTQIRVDVLRCFHTFESFQTLFDDCRFFGSGREPQNKRAQQLVKMWLAIFRLPAKTSKLFGGKRANKRLHVVSQVLVIHGGADGTNASGNDVPHRTVIFVAEIFKKMESLGCVGLAGLGSFEYITKYAKSI